MERRGSLLSLKLEDICSGGRIRGPHRLRSWSRTTPAPRASFRQTLIRPCSHGHGHQPGAAGPTSVLVRHSVRFSRLHLALVQRQASARDLTEGQPGLMCFGRRALWPINLFHLHSHLPLHLHLHSCSIYLASLPRTRAPSITHRTSAQGPSIHAFISSIDGCSVLAAHGSCSEPVSVPVPITFRLLASLRSRIISPGILATCCTHHDPSVPHQLLSHRVHTSTSPHISPSNPIHCSCPLSIAHCFRTCLCISHIISSPPPSPAPHLAPPPHLHSALYIYIHAHARLCIPHFALCSGSLWSLCVPGILSSMPPPPLPSPLSSLSSLTVLLRPPFLPSVPPIDPRCSLSILFVPEERMESAVVTTVHAFPHSRLSGWRWLARPTTPILMTSFMYYSVAASLRVSRRPRSISPPNKPPCQR
ncbi:hypothetical protein C8Q76DRAFT_744776 [Earliella scabrosa]|nr:hypothetical protein C8Q76DRAFT_744776 [Earliella scabrosa]